YGALSNASGRVEIGWYLNTGTDGAGIFGMSWEESGGPCVTVPSRRGFGSTVICRMLSESLNGRVALDYPATGLNWRFECLALEVTGNAQPPLEGPQDPRQPDAERFSCGARSDTELVQTPPLSAHAGIALEPSVRIAKR